MALAVRRSAATRARRWVRQRVRQRIRVRHQLVARGWLGLGLVLFLLGLGRVVLRLGYHRRLDDLNVLDDVAGLAPELACQLVGVEGPRHEHPVILVHDLLDDKLASVLDGGQDPLDLGTAAAAPHVHRDAQRRHLLHIKIHLGSGTAAPTIQRHVSLGSGFSKAEGERATEVSSPLQKKKK